MKPLLKQLLKISVLFIALYLAPLYSFAVTDYSSLMVFLVRTMQQAVPFFIGLAVVIFLFGVLKYVSAGDSDVGRQGARNTMLWGIIAIFTMVSIWGFVNLIDRSLLLNNAPIRVPIVAPN